MARTSGTRSKALQTRSSGGFLHLLGLVAMLISLFSPLITTEASANTTMSAAQASMLAAQQPLDRDIASFNRVVLVGDFQTQLGCNAWDTGCSASTLQSNGGFWTGVFTTGPLSSSWQLVGIDTSGAEYDLGSGNVNVADDQTGVYVEFNSATRESNVSPVARVATLNGSFGTIALAQDGSGFVASSVNVSNDGPVDYQINLDTGSVTGNVNLSAGSNSISFDADGNVTNVQALGNGNLTVQRTDADGNPLSGSCFVLDGASQSRGCDSDDGNNDGQTTLNFPAGFQSGTYTLRETTPADGQDPVDDQQIDLQTGANTQQVSSGAGLIQVSSETTQTGDLVVLRQDENGNAVGGACFEIQHENGNSVASACDEDGDVADDGRIGLLGVPVGDYTLHETRTPDGYEPATDTSVSVAADQVVNQSVQSNATVVEIPTEEATEEPTEVPTEEATEVPTQTGDIVIYLTDENGNPIGGACFAVFDSSNNKLGEQCDEDGFVADDGTTGIYDIPVGEQTIKQTRTPDGSETAPDTSFVVEADVQKAVTIIAPVMAAPTEEATATPTETPQTGDIVIYLTDENGNPVGGACFAVFDADGNKLGEQCDEDGFVADDGTTGIYDIPVGEQTIRETRTPDGYETAADTTFVVEADIQKAVTISAPIAGEPTEVPTEEPTEVPTEEPTEVAEGASLAVTVPSDTQVCVEIDSAGAIGLLDIPYACDNGDNDTDDTPGLIRMTGLQEGDFEVVVYQGPDELIQAGPTPVTLTSGETTTIDLVPEQPTTTSFAITTVDKNGNPVGGACYSIDNGEAVCDDGSGVLTVNDIAPGEHTVVMTSAPTGHDLPDPALQTVDVASDGSSNLSFTVAKTLTTFTISTTDGTNPVGNACYSFNNGNPFCDRGDGVRKVTGVVPGEHLVTMTSAPDGYTLADPVSQTVTIAPDGSTNVVFVVSPMVVTADLTINTVDEVNGDSLADACYTLDGGDEICDEGGAGQIVIPDVVEGDHQLVMTSAPDGFQPAADMTVSTDEPEIVVPLVEEVGALNITFVDGDSNPVGDVCIIVDGGNEICDDDADGTIPVTDLTPGDHEIAVTSVPDGFNVPDPQTVTIVADETAQLPIALEQTPPATGNLDVTVKYSDDTPVVGACITATSGATQIDLCDGDADDTNNIDGVIGLGNIPVGQYEVGLAEGYTPDRPVDVVVPVNQHVDAGEGAGVDLVLPLLPETGSLQLVTTANGVNVEGACFALGTLTVCDGDSNDADGTNGVVLITDLDPDTYSVSMSTVPTGYQQPADQNAEITAGETSQLNFELTAIAQPGSLTVTTMDDDGNPLGNACYTVVKNGVTIATACDATDANPNDGQVIFENLAADTYQVVQKQAPSGQFQTAPTQTVTINPGENTDLEIVMSLRPGRLTVLTVAKEEPTLILTNACYTLTGGSTFGPFCDADDGTVDGRVRFTNVPAGEYTLKQTVATAGYEVAANRTVTITAGGALQITVQNAKVQPPAESGTLVVIPLDPNGDPVAGGCYQVFDGTTPVTQRICDNADVSPAQITFENVPVGTFTLRESLAPSPDWQIAADIQVTIRNGETTTVKVPHSYKNGAVVIQAVNSVGLPLQGACFTLTNAGNVEICTDATGQATVSGLAPGSRTLTQTKAPFGYKLNTTPRTVNVNPGQTTTVRVVFENQPPANTGTLQVQKFQCPAGDEGERTRFLGGAQGNNELKQTAGCTPAVATFTLVAEDGSTDSNATFTTNAEGRAQLTVREGIYLLTETKPDLAGNSAARVRVATGQLTTVIVINYVEPPAPEPVTINVEGYTCAPGFSGSSFADFQASCMATGQLTNQITVRAEGVNRYKQITGDGGVVGKTTFNDLPAGTYTIWAERPFNIPLNYLFCGSDPKAPTQKAVNGSISTTQSEGATITCYVFQVPSLYDETHGAIQVQKFNCPINERQRGYDYKNECSRPTESIAFSIQQIDTKTGDYIGTPVQVSTNGDGIAQFPMLAAGTYKLTEVGGQWCFAQSNSVNASGDVVVKNNTLSEVWVYNCVGTKSPPNTGSGDAAGLLNQESDSDTGTPQVLPQLIWPTVLLGGYMTLRNRRQA